MPESVGGWWCARSMPRCRDAGSPEVVYRTARAGLRVTRGQRRLTGLLVSAGDLWCCVLELNAWRPAGRVFTCPHCHFTGHRDLVAAASIAAALAAGPRQPSSRLTSPTAEPGTTFPVSPEHDVTRAAAPITAAPAGPLAGTGPPRPPRPGFARGVARPMARTP